MNWHNIKCVSCLLYVIPILLIIIPIKVISKRIFIRSVRIETWCAEQMEDKE